MQMDISLMIVASRCANSWEALAASHDVPDRTTGDLQAP